ncbi:MAG: hypothetical protein NTY53_00810 [Kiritimatiellaeota bacterium]|nr:hypothetical protein [Kiritimatiellota bacterium]
MFYSSTELLRSVTQPTGQNWAMASGPSPAEIRATHHSETSPLYAAAMAFIFALVFIGVSLFTSYVEREQKSAPHERSQIPAMVILR